MNVNDVITKSHQACPHCGGPVVEYSGLMEKKDACYYKVKASAKVWPSAYASGRLVQCRKKGAANYGNKSEGVAEGLDEAVGTDTEREVAQAIYMEGRCGVLAIAINQANPERYKLGYIYEYNVPGTEDMYLDPDDFDALDPEEQQQIKLETQSWALVHAYVVDQQTKEYIDARGRHSKVPDLNYELNLTRKNVFPATSRDIVNITADMNWNDATEEWDIVKGLAAWNQLGLDRDIPKALDYAVKYLNIDLSKGSQSTPKKSVWMNPGDPLPPSSSTGTWVILGPYKNVLYRFSASTEQRASAMKDQWCKENNIDPDSNRFCRLKYDGNVRLGQPIKKQGVAESKQPGKSVTDAIQKVLPIAQEIWFHGSRATGSHRRNSDTDILVVIPDELAGDQYLAVVRILQKLSSSFDNYDIQPTKSGTNIHRIAQEEGQLLWSNKQSVAEGLTETRNSLFAFVKQQFPTWPDYVLKDFLYAQAKGIRDQAELDDFLKRNKQDFGNCKWTLTKLPITFDIFTPKTQRMLASREGGSSNPFQVPRDAERHAQQSQMIQQKGVSAEPIIVAKLSNGYDLIEGWHRTIQHLKTFPEGYTGPAWVCTGATYKSENVNQGVAEEWSKKYKSSINCSHPKGFSQKAHCAGKKKNNESIETEMVCEDCGMCETHGDSSRDTLRDTLDEACWKGYHKEGNKKMFGKTYPNCVKNTNEEQDGDTAMTENQDELARILELGGVQLTEQLSADQQFDMIEEMVEQLAEAHGVDSEVIWEDFESVDDDELFETAAWRRSAGKSKKGGLNAKGVASYRRENPGSKLQMAVTTKPSKLKPGSKAAKRRKSFCARMGGVKGPMKKPNGKPTRKALALRKWNC